MRVLLALSVLLVVTAVPLCLAKREWVRTTGEALGLLGMPGLLISGVFLIAGSIGHH